MLGVEVSGHGLGVAVYHYRAVPYMTAVAVAWTQQSSNSMPCAIVMPPARARQPNPRRYLGIQPEVSAHILRPAHTAGSCLAQTLKGLR